MKSKNEEPCEYCSAKLKEANELCNAVDLLRIEHRDLDNRLDVYLHYRELHPGCSQQLLYDLIILGLGKERCLTTLKHSLYNNHLKRMPPFVQAMVAKK